MKFDPLVTMMKATASDSNEQDGIASNGKMIALAWASQASISVVNANKQQNFDPSTPLIRGHSGNIQDLQWNPFEDRLLASSADDGKVKLWIFDDEEGCATTGRRTESDMEIEAHNRKCLNM